MKALILSAGYGTRLKPYTNKIPKPLFELDAKPILEYSIQKLIHARCTGIIINTHHLHNQIETYIQSQIYPIPVETRFEPAILDTAGAIKNVQDFLGQNPFWVVNSDIVTDIDFADIFEYHCSHPFPATLVLHDFPEFNVVSVDKEQMIQGFRLNNPSLEKLAFTGIQILDPSIFNEIPENTVVSSIDIYKTLIRKNKGVRAYIAENPYWADIGSPEKYSLACINAACHHSLGLAAPVFSEITKLKGDGSDRKWYRLVYNQKSVILGDHGISASNEIITEIDSFIYINDHLSSSGLPVPKIYYTDTFPGHVYLEDLGDTDLATVINTDKTTDSILHHYKRILKLLCDLSVKGRQGFDISKAYQSSHYDKALIMENECRYFFNAFLSVFTTTKVSFDELQNEFSELADRALKYAVSGFIHRDLQSRNIMVKNDQYYFIDFQGGRIGPLQYDLASLLIDPYVNLPESVQQALVDFFIDQLADIIPLDRDHFLEGYTYLKITRNLQMLGAFGFLSKVKGKKYFESFIPTAVSTLKKNIKKTDADLFTKLKKVIERL